MSYSVINSVASINGANGPYDSKVKNESVKYARNAISNFMSYVDEFKKAAPAVPSTDGKKLLEHTKDGFTVSDDTFNKAVDSVEKHGTEVSNFNKLTPPLKFEHQYMAKPETPEKIDKMALMGAAFEEMGKKISMPVQELTKKMQAAFGDKVNANAFDVNKDGQVDIGEYAASIVLEDMMSKDPNKLDYKNVTGVVTNKGQDALMQYIAPKNPQYAAEEVALLHKSQELDKAKNLFAADPNNMVE